MRKTSSALLRKACIAAFAVVSICIFAAGCEKDDKDKNELSFSNESSKTVIFNLGGYGDQAIEPGQTRFYGPTKKGSNVTSETLYYYIVSPSSVVPDQTDSRTVIFRDK